MSYLRKQNGRNFYLHDDRGKMGGVKQTVFKQMDRGGRRGGWDQKPKKFYLDEDDDMGPTTSSNRGGNDWTVVQSRRNKSRGMMRFLVESQSGYYEVTVCHGSKYNRQELLKTIQGFVHPNPFQPLNVRLDSGDLKFYVDNHRTATAINNSNFRLQMKDGWKMQIKVKGCIPQVELTPGLKEKIKQVMSLKYNASTGHMDLSEFHTHPEFVQNDFFVPLNRQNMLLAVFQIIAESVPNLISLDLSGNRIFTTQHFTVLKQHALQLKSLLMTNNKLKALALFECLKGMKLEDLNLDGNPLCDRFSDHSVYVREVRKIFKQLRRLDGVELPKPVCIDEEDVERSLPPGHASFLCTAEGGEFTKKFLEQFFTLYDNVMGRDGLAEAYADGATFSMSAFSFSGMNLGKYVSESRNLKKVNILERRQKLLRSGKPEIIRYLNTLPKTSHLLPTFAVDLLLFTPKMVCLCVCGLFRELGSSNGSQNNSNVRCFTRNFILVSTPNGGFNIINDILCITNPTDTQMKSIRESENISQASPSSQMPAPAIIQPIAIPSPVMPIPAASIDVVEMTHRRELVATLAGQTGMNLAWAEKCLTETNWNPSQALYAFGEFNKSGRIPPEAFIK